MPQPRAMAAQWPTAGERHAAATMQYATPTTDAMGGRTEPTWTDVPGTWWVKVNVLPFVVDETKATALYQLEGPYRTDLQTYFDAGTSLRALVNGKTLKVMLLENPQLRNRTLVAHCANALHTS